MGPGAGFRMESGGVVHVAGYLAYLDEDLGGARSGPSPSAGAVMVAAGNRSGAFEVPETAAIQGDSCV